MFYAEMVGKSQPVLVNPVRPEGISKTTNQPPYSMEVVRTRRESHTACQKAQTKCMKTVETGAGPTTDRYFQHPRVLELCGGSQKLRLEKRLVVLVITDTWLQP